MATYLDDAQRQALAAQAKTWTWRTQWPTWVLIVTIYASWFGVATHARELGLPVAVALLALLGAWYMSLQHELLHGHPTRSPFVNALIGFAPLAVWFPYRVYRDSHLQHHDDAHLTQPEHDPESYFVSARRWHRAGWAIRALLTWRNTFVGRLIIGPAFSLAATAVEALGRFKRGDWRDLPAWLAHGVALVALTWWLQQFCAIPAWAFIVGAGYGALSLGSIRSFQEHRVAGSHEHRTVINEAAWFWRLLFLNNNYHLVHHDLPGVPWFALKEVYEASRSEYIERSGGFLVNGYSEWLKLHAVSPVAHPAHGESSGFVDDDPQSSVSFADQWQ
ncbi:fatty acid desaturase [Paraburkholderia sp. BCC1886]|uniref:fatty acid desaturase n=1 Tax=Paraburkholderia sp. BCC1886 TaxID=2562670 RepID=UPI0011824BB9|nr:fatty acid desaturase [Paraburkholderia sp. BCC1886]